MRDAGSVALALILLEGGVLANVPAIRKVLEPSVLLATLGVLITAGIASLAAHWALDLHWRTALLVGAVVSSTDAAAVFAAVRGLGLRHRVESVLELESVPLVADLDTATLQTLRAELIELVPADLAIGEGTEIRSLRLPGAAIIIAIRRDDALVVPRGDSALQANDRLYLLVERARLDELQAGLEIAAG